MSMTQSTKGAELKDLKPVAREALDAFESIAASASADLSRRGVTLDSFAIEKQIGRAHV